MPIPLLRFLLRVASLGVVALFVATATWEATAPLAPRPVRALAAVAGDLPRRAAPEARGSSLSLEAPIEQERVLPEGPAAAGAAAPARGHDAGAALSLVLDTPLGRFAYERAVPVLATYYTPANCGKAPDSPAYGITATGARATRGIVAVDPRVIPLYTWLYVPGYGVAQARDVGSAVIGDHIDVAFDDGDGAWWGRRYLTVYVLPSTASGR